VVFWGASEENRLCSAGKCLFTPYARRQDCQDFLRSSIAPASVDHNQCQAIEVDARLSGTPPVIGETVQSTPPMRP
jgi:hypothetical protein